MISEQELHAATILVVDDEPMTAKFLEELLKHAGYKNTRSTTQPSQAFSLYRDLKPDLILVDLVVPVINGYQVIEQLKASDPKAYFPVLVITGQKDQGILMQTFELGAKDYLTKPYEADEVVLRVRNILETGLLVKKMQQEIDSLKGQIQGRPAGQVQTY